MIRSRCKALADSKGLREVHALERPMPPGNWDLLDKNIEVARFSKYVLGAFQKRATQPKKYSETDLMDDLVREMKFLRKIVGKEKDFLPEVLLKEVLATVWNARKSG